MYYRLKEPWAFRGWKKLPFAVCAMAGEKKHEEPFLMEKEPFLELLCCNGEEDVDISAFSEKGKTIIKEMTKHGIMEQSEGPMQPLSSFQRYHVYPSRRIKSVHWSITGKCNFNCRHCLVSAPNAHHPQLPLSDCLHIVEEIAKCGVNRVDVTGGEPLVRRDFEEIVKALSERNIDIGVLFTNASLLTGDTLDMLEKYRQHPVFQLSFDGLKHHDWLRGVAGAEKQADAAFRLLKERGYTVNAAMCIHRENRDSLRSTANYLAEMNVQNLRVNAPQSLGRISLRTACPSGWSWTGISAAKREKPIIKSPMCITPRTALTGESIPTAKACAITRISGRKVGWPPAWAFPIPR